MKKIFVICSLFAAAISSQAYDEVGIVPVTVEPNTTATVYFTLNNTSMRDLCKTITLNVEWPEGWTISKSPSLNHDRVYDWDEDFEEWGKESNFTIANSNPSPGITRYFAYSTNNHSMNGDSGWIISVKVKAPAGTPAGFYPVKINAGSYMTMSAKDDENIIFDDIVSYIKVGNPEGEQSLALAGLVPSFVNTALASETAISTLNLSAVTEVNGDFTYVDGRAVTAPAAELEVSAKYAKTVAEGKYASLTLPFDATFGDETAYTFTEVEGDYAKFDAVTSAQAGDVVLLTKSVNLTGSKLSTVAGATAAKAYYVSQDGSELRQGTNVNVPALRGVWEIEGAGSNLRIMLDGIATDIKMSDLVGEGAQAFDLQGRRTANAKNGVYVVNGKKQIVK